VIAKASIRGKCAGVAIIQAAILPFSDFIPYNESRVPPQAMGEERQATEEKPHPLADSLSFF
jgi:hypothetical protein